MKCPTTLIVSITAIVALAFPSVSDICQVDFGLIACGQWWRTITGHFTHFDLSHLFWDLLMFVTLGFACESKHRKAFPMAIILMAAGITAAIASACDGIVVYRGLSGIDTGLFVWFVIDQCRYHWTKHERSTAVLWIAPALALIGKLIFEAQTGQTLFVDSSGFTPLVESHLAGAAIGAIDGLAIPFISSLRARTPICRRTHRSAC